jgi:hypothetical protein
MAEAENLQLGEKRVSEGPVKIAASLLVGLL